MADSNPDIIIISGLSGSGKSVALQSLEDIGYYCIDNLPAALLLEFCKRLFDNMVGGSANGTAGAAVSIDSRNKQFLSDLGSNLSELENHGIRYRILFLDAEEQRLVRRYSETRRKHPLTDDKTPLIEGIRQERNLLKPLNDRAEKIIDTTETTPHELRGLIRDFAGAGLATGPLILLESFGFKNGTPREADFVFDVRCLPNPYWEASLAPLSGMDEAVQSFLGEKPDVQRMIDEIFGFFNRWLPGFASENRSYITVAVGCTGGRHRSVYIAERLKQTFLENGVSVQVRHRDLGK